MGQIARRTNSHAKVEVRESMTELIGGYLYVGCNDKDEVVINHPDLKPDKDGVGYGY